MIKKKDCLEFLDKVENKAIKSVEKKYEAEIEKAQYKILEPYKAEIEAVQHLTNELHVKSLSLYTELRESPHIRLYDDYHNLPHEINDFTGEHGIIDRIIYKSTFDGGSVQKIKDKMGKELAEVKAEYLKVKTVCQNKSNGAQAAEYLKGIGFDISSLEKAENTALLPQLNKKYLFVCGENK